MTAPGPATPGSPAAEWAEEIGAFGALLDAVERQLAEAADPPPMPAWQPPRTLAGPPTARELARAQELLDRAEQCRVELEAQLRATASALDDLGRRRTAAQRYGSTA